MRARPTLVSTGVGLDTALVGRSTDVGLDTARARALAYSTGVRARSRDDERGAGWVWREPDEAPAETGGWLRRARHPGGAREGLDKLDRR
ncbi:hypothetical protein [Demetria terragena]|uniref:hypothetical protein n=1 Tax=Demetria terragena TaxID=63959 RepID=UPI000381A8F9|nr:hypothetical protein [Demetria terragena]